jgi:hypothetical protein
MWLLRQLQTNALISNIAGTVVVAGDFAVQTRPAAVASVVWSHCVMTMLGLLNG